MSRVSSITNFLLLAATVLTALGIAEIVVRVAYHIKPGTRFDNQWFEEVDSLYMLRGMQADSMGIFKIDAEAANEVNTRIALYELNKNKDILLCKAGEVFEVYQLAMDYTIIDTPNNEFEAYIKKLKSTPPALLSELEKATIQYTQSPINADGFKSIDMKPYNGARKKVLLLGDSFTWGHSTTKKTNSFADILLSRGYAIYNTGISGSDPAQYEALARYYIPKLKPDIVVVNFYMGNDVFWFVRKPVPGIPIHYTTNAGNLVSCPDGIYFTTADSVYAYATRSMRIPTHNQFVKHTALGTLIWRVATKNNWINVTYEVDTAYWKTVETLKQPKPASNQHLLAIQQLSDSFGAKCLTVAIPHFQRSTSIYPQQIPGLFDEIKWTLSPVKKEDYELANGHFNDKGHATYANFLESEIERH